MTLFSEAVEVPLTEFETFWRAYPKRQGVKVGKQKAAGQWANLKPAEREAAMVSLATYERAKGDYPEDAERYLRHRRWVGLEVETAPGVRSGGSVTGDRAEGPVRRGVWSDD